MQANETIKALEEHISQEQAMWCTHRKHLQHAKDHKYLRVCVQARTLSLSGLQSQSSSAQLILVHAHA